MGDDLPSTFPQPSRRLKGVFFYLQIHNEFTLIFEISCLKSLTHTVGQPWTRPTWTIRVDCYHRAIGKNHWSISGVSGVDHREKQLVSQATQGARPDKTRAATFTARITTGRERNRAPSIEQ